ncbi:PE domain-containing protein, partial [Nocardia abscessus]
MTVVPAGGDEVSGRAAQTANDVASSYLRARRPACTRCASWRPR